MIYLYDHVGNKIVRIVTNLESNLTEFGYTDREVQILQPLVATMLDLLDVNNMDLAQEKLHGRTHGFAKRLVNKGLVHDLRLDLSFPIQRLIAPHDPSRLVLFVKFMYRHNNQMAEGRFVLATKSFDPPDYAAIANL